MTALELFRNKTKKKRPLGALLFLVRRGRLELPQLLATTTSK
jgi:hypothetical protein